MTKKQIEKAADQASEALLMIACHPALDLSGEERDAIALVRTLCADVDDGDRWTEPKENGDG